MPTGAVSLLTSSGQETTGGEDGMNWFHRQVCRSGRWRRRVEGELLPWALQGVELGDDVLEIGPGPGVTTDLLRGRTRRLTALEVDAAAAAALRQRLNGSGVRVVHGDGVATPFADGSFSSVVAFTMLHHVPTAALSLLTTTIGNHPTGPERLHEPQ